MPKHLRERATRRARAASLAVCSSRSRRVYVCSIQVFPVIASSILIANNSQLQVWFKAQFLLAATRQRGETCLNSRPRNQGGRPCRSKRRAKRARCSRRYGSPRGCRLRRRLCAHACRPPDRAGSLLALAQRAARPRHPLAQSRARVRLRRSRDFDRPRQQRSARPCTIPTSSTCASRRGTSA